VYNERQLLKVLLNVVVNADTVAGIVIVLILKQLENVEEKTEQDDILVGSVIDDKSVIDAKVEDIEVTAFNDAGNINVVILLQLENALPKSVNAFIEVGIVKDFNKIHPLNVPFIEVNEF
jgi:hypothetical protein